MTKKEIKKLKAGSVIGNGRNNSYLICINGKRKKTLIDLETYKIISLKEFDKDYFSNFVFFS